MSMTNDAREIRYSKSDLFTNYGEWVPVSEVNWSWATYHGAHAWPKLSVLNSGE